MEKTRNALLQIGTLILCINGGLWFKDSLTGNEPNGPAVILFRLGVCLLGLVLLGVGGILTAVIYFNRTVPRPLNRVEQISDDELFD
jgi:hypothetical protein